MPRTRLFALAAAFLLPATAFAAGKAVDWSSRVALSPVGGHVMGNPAARTKVVEYVSYTCTHCAQFVAEGTAPLKAGWVKSGRASVEVRNAVRDKYDLTAALLARCGGPARFFGNHEALFANQDAWMEKLMAYDAAHREPVAGQSRPAMMQDIGRGTGLYALLQKRGLGAKQLDACLSDPAALARVTAMAEDAWQKVKITGTPAFAVNGKLVDGATWDSLRAALPAVHK